MRLISWHEELGSISSSKVIRWIQFEIDLTFATVIDLTTGSDKLVGGLVSRSRLGRGWGFRGLYCGLGSSIP